MSDAPEAYVYEAELERVIDGDTIDITRRLAFDVNSKKQRVRS